MELAVLIFRSASSLGVSPCSRYGDDSRLLGRVESSETVCTEGKVMLNASSRLGTFFSCPKGELFMFGEEITRQEEGRGDLLEGQLNHSDAMKIFPLQATGEVK